MVLYCNKDIFNQCQKNVMIAPFVAHTDFHRQRLKPSRKGASPYEAKQHQQSQQHNPIQPPKLTRQIRRTPPSIFANLSPKILHQTYSIRQIGRVAFYH